MRRVRRAGLLLAILALAVGAWLYLRPVDPWKHCRYSYLRPDRQDLARRIESRARERQRSMFSDEEWAQRALLLPMSGTVDCGSFRATIDYVVDAPRADVKAPPDTSPRVLPEWRIKVTGDQDAYRRFREDTKGRGESPFNLEMAKWRSSR